MDQQKLATRSAVIVISSHVARGSVGNRAAVFALEALGFPVWAVPTAVLPWHLGHGPATRIVPPLDQFSALLADLERAPWLGEVGAVLSGYLGEAGQADAVASLVRAVKRNNPGALYLCDPVMGDEGDLYVSETTAKAIRGRLMPLADIATPNRYELEWMTGENLTDLQSTIAIARTAGPAMMLVTSAPATAANSVANLLVGENLTLLAEHPLVANPPKGLGDLTSAVYLARVLAGLPANQALQSATAAVHDILARTVARGGDELQLETDAQYLSRPTARVEMRDISQTIGSLA